MKNFGNPGAGEPLAPFYEGGQASAGSLLYELFRQSESGAERKMGYGKTKLTATPQGIAGIFARYDSGQRFPELVTGLSSK